MPPASENRHPCSACVNEIKDWLMGLPAEIRPSGLDGDGEDGVEQEGESALPE